MGSPEDFPSTRERNNVTDKQFDALTPEQHEAMALDQFCNAKDALEVYRGSLPGIIDSRPGNPLGQWLIISAALITAMRKSKAGPEMMCMTLATALLALHDQEQTKAFSE